MRKRIKKLITNRRWMWSYSLTLIGVTGAYFAGRNYWWGWLISLGAQPIWIAYAIRSKQYGFIGAPLFFIPVYIENMISWLRN